jgi:hypothetical protein
MPLPLLTTQRTGWPRLSVLRTPPQRHTCRRTGIDAGRCAGRSRGKIPQGHTAEIRSLLQKYGADKLSKIDPANYKALLADAEVLDRCHLKDMQYSPLQASDRWLHCPPSARLCESYTDKGSDYAAEGTDAHALCEYKLRKALGLEAEDPTENLTWYNEEMNDCANGYAAYVLEQVEAAKQVCADPVVLIEQRVDFSRWVEDGFGTADALIIADGTLKICDYKHGLGVLVRAEKIRSSCATPSVRWNCSTKSTTSTRSA